MKRKFFAFALAMALCLCLLPISTQAMMQESDFGKWIGGDSNCPHTNTSEPYGNPPDEGDHPGTHLKVVECGDCGAQFVTRENCTDANNDKKCDGCNQNMPVQQTDINDATVKVNTIFGNNTEYQTGTDPITPSVTVYDKNGDYMYENDDYTVEYGDNNQAGTGKILLTGKAGGRLTGTRLVTFNIKTLNGNLANSSNTVYLFVGENTGDTFPYTGSQIKPEVMVELDDMWTLTGNEYSVEYGPNVEPGQGWVKLTGNGRESGGVPITGERTVYFKISEAPPCKHDGGTVAVNDGDLGHHFECAVCGQDMSEGHILAHVVETVDEDAGSHIFRTEKCQICPWTKEIGQMWKLDKVSLTGLKEEGAVYNESEANRVGLEGLTESVDYTRTVQDSGDNYVVIMDPVEGKSVGSRQVELDKCKHETTVAVNDGDLGHHFECAVCGQDMSEGHILAHVVETVDEDAGSHIFRTEKCQVCPWTKEIGQMWKLDKAPLTGLKEEGAEYTESETKQIGLEGLTEGVEYTRTVTSVENGDGTKSWVITMEPVTNKAIGERTVTVKAACTHDGGRTCVSDGENGHHYECDICGADLNEGQFLPHDLKFVQEETDTHIFTYQRCEDCRYTTNEAQMWKLDNAQVGEVSAQEYTGAQIKPTPEVTVGGEKLVPGQDFTYEYGENKYPGVGEVRIVSVEGKSRGSKKVTFEITEKNDLDCQHDVFEWGSDEQNHWEICTNCGHKSDSEAHAYAPEVVAAANCTQDAVIVMKCKCGRVDPNGRTAPAEGDPAEWFAHHSWSAEYESDFWDHWRTCTVCGVKEEKQTHALINVTVLVQNDCLTNGSIQADCSVCGRKGMGFSAGIESEVAQFPILEQYKALGHDFSGPVTWFTGPRVCTEEGQGTHAPTCVRCNAHDDANQTAHAWAGLHTVQNGSCDNPNDPVIQEAECECGATLHLEKTREHMFVDDKSQDVQPTCLEPGKINGQRCTICGIFANYDFVPALGHDIQIVENTAATCLTEGFIHRQCTRCDLDETAVLPTLGGDGKHHFKPVASTQPTCTTDGTYNGEKCENCPEERAGETGYGIIPALGHKVSSSTAAHGKTRTAVGKDGRPIEIQVYVTTFSCKRCGASLGGETFTVATSIGKLSGQYRIEPGVVTITDMENGIHVNGNMAKDGGVYFNDLVQQAYEGVIKDAGTKYTYKKVETKSFIIEFTDEFLDELEDGEYELVVINGNEYWPMMVTVRDHRFKALRDVDIPDMPELTEEEFDALLKDLSADGEIIQRFFLNQPVIKPENDGAPNENGDIVAVRNDGDYVFESLVNGDYTLEQDKDYTVDDDTVTIKAEYLNGVADGSEIVFHYADFGMEGAPLPHEPKLLVK